MSLNVELIRESFAKAVPIADQVADHFYETLFTDYPDAKEMFKNVNMVQQKKALINSLVFIVDHLESSEQLTKYLKDMGARHLDYGTGFQHFDWVGATLLKTFAFFFDDEWNDELEKTWADAYGVIASVMKEGLSEATEALTEQDTVSSDSSAESEAEPQPESQSLQNHLRQMTLDLAREVIERTFNEELEQRFEALAKEKAQAMLEKALKEMASEAMASTSAA